MLNSIEMMLDDRIMMKGEASHHTPVITKQLRNKQYHLAKITR